MNFNGVVYIYLHNIQGDIVGILDNRGNKIVEYDYDAWGKPIYEHIVSSEYQKLSELNPFRYRGYVIELPLNLYYLNSRYYNADMKRFINADVAIGVNDDNSTNNLFTYCGNNPGNRFDRTGMFWDSVKRLWTDGLVNIFLDGVFKALDVCGVDTAEAGAKFLNAKKEGDVYYIKPDCWQAKYGYNRLYDFAFDIGTDMKTKRFTFDYDGESYAIWLWKGDYINMGAGAEMAIYYGGGPHWKVNKSLAMNMSMSVEYQGKTIINRSDNTWWMTGFSPSYQNVRAKDLTVKYTASFNNVGMYYAFQASKPIGWSFDSASLSATYIF